MRLKELPHRDFTLVREAREYKDGIYTVWTPEAGRYAGEPQGHIHFLSKLEADTGNGRFVTRQWSIPEVKEDDDVDAKLKPLNGALGRFAPTHAYLNGDGKFSSVKFFNEDGTPREWGDLRFFEIDSSDPKLSKRSGMLGTRTDMHDLADFVLVTDDEYYPPEDGVITLRVRDVREDYINGVFPVQPEIIDTLEPNFRTGKERIYNADRALEIFNEFIDTLEKFVDGSFMMREEVAEDILERCLSSIQDEERRERVAEAHRVRALNARFPTPIGTIKGDVNLVSTVMNTDVMTYACNITKGFRTREQKIAMIFTPQGQGRSVRTNRQLITHFSETLLDVNTPNRRDSRGLIYDAFKDLVDSEIRAFRNGETMSFVDPAARNEADPIRDVQTRAKIVSDAGLSLNEFLGLQMDLAGQRIKMWAPGPDESDPEKKQTRMPSPYAMGWSVRNETSFYQVYGYFPDLKRGESLVDALLGLIVSNHDWLDIIDSLGGADLDDHVEVYYRKALNDGSFQGIEFKAGETVLFLVRSPIGMVLGEKNGVKVLASEYYILKPSPEADESIRDYYGDLPVIDLNRLPAHVHEVTPLFGPNGELRPVKPAPVSEYSATHFWGQVKAASKLHYVYDKHASYMRKIMLLGPSHYPPYLLAREDFFIDVVAQWRDVEQLAIIHEDNLRLKEFIPEEMPDNAVSDYTAIYRHHTARFANAAMDHVKAMFKRLKEEAATHTPSITRMHNNELVPVLVQYIEVMEGRMKTGTHTAFEAIGNEVYNALMKIIANGSVEDVTADTLPELMRDARAWYLSKTEEKDYPGVGVNNFLTPTDRKLMRGRMLDLLIDALL